MMLAEFLQKEIDKRGLRYLDVGQKAGISPEYISRIINKQRIP